MSAEGRVCIDYSQDPPTMTIGAPEGPVHLYGLEDVVDRLEPDGTVVVTLTFQEDALAFIPPF